MKKLILSLLLLYSAMAFSQGTIPIPQVTGLPAALNSKVDKVTGKSLVSDTSIVKLTGVQAGAQVNKLEGIQKNGVDLPITGKKVNITVPTTAAEIGAQPAGTYSTDIHSNITALNAVSGTNSGDETLTSIKTKLGAASSSNSGYLTNTDFVNFSGKQNALGFTPYNATNPSGYISGINSGMVTTALGYTPLPTRTFGSAANNNAGDFYAAGSTVANSTLWNGTSYSSTSNDYTGYFMTQTGDGVWKYSTVTQVKTGLGLGSNAYNSTAYLPLSGGTMSNSNLVSNLNSQYLNGNTYDNFVSRYGGYSSNINTSYNAQGTCFWANTTIGRPTDYGVLLSISDKGQNWNNQLGFDTDNNIWFRQAINNADYTGVIVWNKVYHSGNLTNNLSTNQIPKWNGSSMANSILSDNGSTDLTVGNLSNPYTAINFKSAGQTSEQRIVSAGSSMIFDNFDGDYNFRTTSSYLPKLKILNSGDVSILNATASTSTTTGALVVDGGIGIGGRINSFSDIQAGAIGNERSIIARYISGYGSNSYLALTAFGGNVGIGYTSDQNYRLSVNGGALINGSINLNSNTTIRNIWSGTNGGCVQILGDPSTTNRWARIGVCGSDGGFYAGLTITNDGNSTFSGNAIANGKIIVSNTTDATIDPTPDGSIVTSGGIAAAKRIQAGIEVFSKGNIIADGDMYTGGEISAGTTITASGNIYSNGGELLTPVYQTQTTVNGSTSGNMVCSMPFRTGTYKKVIIYPSSLNGNAVYTFPTAFTGRYKLNTTVMTYTTYTTVIASATSLTITGGSNIDGQITIEGY